MNQQTIDSFANGKKIALYIGGVVYLGAVFLYMAFFETLMAGRFDGVVGVVARIGAVLVAANSVALPVALHYYTVTGLHRIAAVLIYIGDVAFMALNIMASAATEAAPAWILDYARISPASIVFVLVGWAILWMTDPGQRALVALDGAKVNAQVDIVRLVVDFVRSEKGVQTVIKPLAERLAAQVMNDHTLLGYKDPLELPANGGTDVLADLQTVLVSHGWNGNAKQAAEAVLQTVNPTKPATKRAQKPSDSQ